MFIVNDLINTQNLADMAFDKNISQLKIVTKLKNQIDEISQITKWNLIKHLNDGRIMEVITNNGVKDIKTYLKSRRMNDIRIRIEVYEHMFNNPPIDLIYGLISDMEEVIEGLTSEWAYAQDLTTEFEVLMMAYERNFLRIHRSLVNSLRFSRNVFFDAKIRLLHCNPEYNNDLISTRESHKTFLCDEISSKVRKLIMEQPTMITFLRHIFCPKQKGHKIIEDELGTIGILTPKDGSILSESVQQTLDNQEESEWSEPVINLTTKSLFEVIYSLEFNELIKMMNETENERSSSSDDSKPRREERASR